MPASSFANPLAILAFGGRLPGDCVELLKDRHNLFILGMDGITDRSLIRRAHKVFSFYDLKGMFLSLEHWGIRHIMIVGSMRRPPLSVLIKAFSAFRSIPDLKRLLELGDDSLLRGVIGLFEDRGFCICGIDTLAPELLASEGVLTERAPSEAQEASGWLGLDCLRALSPFDVGQAVIVQDRRILGIEGPCGTDKLLSSVDIQRSWRRFLGVEKRTYSGALLVKTSKKDQDMRLDIATIGPNTVCKAARYGFSGIVLGANRTLIVDKAKTLHEANQRRILLFSLNEERAMKSA
jgi:DUF1009 family protein